MYLHLSTEINNNALVLEGEVICLGILSQDKGKDRKDVKDKDGKDGKDGDNNPEPLVSSLLKERGLFCCHPINIGDDLPKKAEFEGTIQENIQPTIKV